MLSIGHKQAAPAEADVLMTLPFAERQKSRLRTEADNGEPVMLMLERGTILRDGDLLLAEDGRVVRVAAAHENLSCARHDNRLVLLRAAYHLGNRHVPLQIDENSLCFLRDAVLADMLRGLGLTIEDRVGPFEPEAGAYGAGHRHGDEQHAPMIHRHIMPKR